MSEEYNKINSLCQKIKNLEKILKNGGSNDGNQGHVGQVGPVGPVGP